MSQDEVLETGDPARGFSPAMAGWLVFFVALAVRLYLLNELRENPSFRYPLVDAGSHHQLALGLQNASAPPADLFWRSVFYPLFLTFSYFATGSSILAAKFLQALLGAATCLLTWQLGRRAFGPACGLTAGLITAFYGPLLFWESELVAVGWAAFWSVALILLAGRARGERSQGATGPNVSPATRPTMSPNLSPDLSPDLSPTGSSIVSHFAFGLVGGLAVLTRPSFLPFVLLTIAWLAWSSRSGGARRAILRSSLAVAGFLALTLPTAVASTAFADHASFLPRAATLNLYLGNHPDRCKTLRIRPGQQWMELRELLAGEVRSAADAPGVFRDRVIEFAMEDPLHFGAGILHKLGQLVAGREIPRNVDIYLFGQWSPLLAALVWKAGSFGFPFGLLFPAAALGLWLRRRDVPTPLAILVVSYPLVIAATFVAGRYRAPLVPVLSILAAAGVLEIVRRIRQREWKTALAPLAVGAVLLAATLRSDPFCEEEVDFHSEMYAFVAMDAAKAKDTVYAQYLYERALEINPRSARAHDAFADFWAGERASERAIKHYDQAILISEDYWVISKRGGMHFVLNDLSSALADFDRSIALNPRHSPAYLGRGHVYYRQGDVEGALAELRHALEHATSRRDGAMAQAAFEFMSANR